MAATSTNIWVVAVCIFLTATSLAWATDDLHAESCIGDKCMPPPTSFADEVQLLQHGTHRSTSTDDSLAQVADAVEGHAKLALASQQDRVDEAVTDTRLLAGPSCNQTFKIAPRDKLAFIHIAKAGGTSMNGWLQKYVCGVHDAWTDIPGSGDGGRSCSKDKIDHADISYMDPKARMFVILREPGSRSASNIQYYQKLEKKGDDPDLMFGKSDWSISRILQNKEAASQYSIAFRDGMGGVCWLAGICTCDTWISGRPKLDDEELERRRELMEDHPEKALNMAKSNLKRMAWIGLTERLEDSLELLSWQLGLPTKAIHVPQANVNAGNTNLPKITEKERQVLREAAPMDVKLYKYAQDLFKARWQEYLKAKSHGQTAADAGCIPEHRSEQ